MPRRVQKVSLAIGAEELAWARRVARETNTSVSALITEAARHFRSAMEERARKDAAWKRFDQWVYGDRPPSEAELESARRVLERASPTRRRRSRGAGAGRRQRRAA